MYIEERPISSKEQDLLGRQRFASKLADSLCKWKDKASLVVGLFGKWGSGKSSVLNLIVEEIDSKPKDDQPTVIFFNPWMVSGQSELYGHFFNEVSSNLELKNEYETDRSLAINLRAYGRLLGAIPEPNLIISTIKQFVLGAGILGVVISQLLPSTASIIVLIVSLSLLVLRLSGKALNAVGEFLDTRLPLKELSLASMKKTISGELTKRNRKLLIILDDIDRLTREEVKSIFQLVKVNSDFPNTIFLLAFDRPLIEKQLDDPVGVSGKDYLEKIVQVHFDIPDANRTAVEQYLFEQLNRTLDSLPEKWQKLFDRDRWVNVYHSGFGQLFESIRHIKRYINSLRFNFGMLVNEGTLEVNPIDFIAIEAIRVFAPQYYEYMKINKELFTYLDSGSIGAGSHNERSSRQSQASESLENVDEKYRYPIKGVLDRVFQGVFDNAIYGEGWWAGWSRELRARHPDHFDAYFTLTPGGDESKLSQFELDGILGALSDGEELKSKIRQTIETGKIRQVLYRLQDYATDSDSIQKDKYEMLIKVLFDLSDEMPETETSMFDVGSLMDIQRVLYQLAKREKDAGFFGSILKRCIQDSESLSSPVQTVSLLTPREDDKPREFEMVQQQDLKELQDLCVKKIKLAQENGALFGSRRLLYHLYRWREWSSDDSLAKTIDSWIEMDEGFMAFLNKFFYIQKSYPLGDYSHQEEDKFNYDSLKDFVDLQVAKERVEGIVETKKELHESNRKVVDLFLSGVDRHIPNDETRDLG